MCVPFIVQGISDFWKRSDKIKMNTMWSSETGMENS
jgi:hypothetical protein